MVTERIREIREWLTFALSLLTLVAVPVLALVLKNQRLELERDFSIEYVHKTLFVDHMNRMDGADKQAMEEIGKLNGKVDLISARLASIDASVTSLRDSFFRGQRPIVASPKARPGE